MATSVPDTNTFYLSDVVAVVGGNSLTSCFANSVDAFFDPAYKGVKDRLSNFRNYKPYYSDVVKISAVNSNSFTSALNATSLEMSSNGKYMYLLCMGPNSNTAYLRRYTLTINYDITTLERTYQIYDMSSSIQWDGDTTGVTGLWLAADQRTMYFTYSHYICKLIMHTANDLSNIDLFSSNDKSDGTFAGANIIKDPTDTYFTMTMSSAGVRNETRTYTNPSGSTLVLSDSQYHDPWDSVGFEWNGTGTSFFILLTYPPTFSLYKYPVGANPYRPTGPWGTPVQPTSTFTIPGSIIDVRDFCFSDNLAYFYILEFTPEYYPKISQYYLQ